MKIFNSAESSGKRTAIAIGCFDGLHKGHMRVIESAVNFKKDGLCPTVFTFSSLPYTKAQKHIMCKDIKEELLEKIGVELLYNIDFPSISHMEARYFAEEILIKTLNAEKICCGYNFSFGKNGVGTPELLKEICKENGIEVIVTDCVKDKDGEGISASRIRNCIEQGDIKKANELLGRNFGFCFSVVHGNHLGKLLGSPTINQKFPEGFVIPKTGVYASLVTAEGKKYFGVTDIGYKPTVGSDRIICETWIPGFSGNLYEKKVKIELCEYIRPEIKFSDMEKLSSQILEDGKKAKKIMEIWDLQNNSVVI